MKIKQIEDMGSMRFKVGDRVQIKSLDWYNENKDEDGNIRYKHGTVYPIFFTKYMSRFCGETVTIKCVHEKSYYMNETGSCEFWTDEMIEGLVEEEIIDLTSIVMETVEEKTIQNALTYGYNLPEGYQFVDENGNVINAMKIILEKKKKEYPKTYAECCNVLNTDDDSIIDISVPLHYNLLLISFTQLLICRDAYWNIAGEEMGLGKSWEPNDSDYITERYCIFVHRGNIICSTPAEDCLLTFPTEEMRDAFKENFDPDIEICKELL